MQPRPRDTSYPGLLYVSYYSTHQARTSIYLAQIKFP